MEQFDKWQEFWDTFLVDRYGKKQAQTEDDLYLQVGQTVNRRPVEREIFHKTIEQISEDLQLSKNDILVDFCCGNGLFTYEFKDKVSQIIGVDFSPTILEAANLFKSSPNIIYCLGGVNEFMGKFRASFPGLVPNKYLMNDSLAYFTRDELREMLRHITEVSRDFIFLAKGVPSDALKWNYYDTEERKQRYYNYPLNGDYTNDGVGKWWDPNEIKELCSELHIGCVIRDQQLPLSNYRMDVIISRGADQPRQR